MFQWGLAAFGPIGIAAAAAITVVMVVGGAGLADSGDSGILDFGDDDSSSQPLPTGMGGVSVVTPSFTPEEVTSIPETGEISINENGKGSWLIDDTPSSELPVEDTSQGEVPVDDTSGSTSEIPVSDTSGSTSEIPVSDTSQAEIDTTESEDDYVKPTVIEYDDGDTVVAFDPSTYSPGQLAPRFTPAYPYGFVTVNVSYEPGDEPQLDDGQYDPPVCAFDLSAQSYDSGAKYVLMLVAGLVLFFWLIQMIAQYRREGW